MKLLVLTCLFISYTYSLAEDTAHNPEQVVVDIAKSAPWGYLENNKIIGLFPEFYRVFETHLNIKAQLKLTPLKRSLHRLRTGETDLFTFIKRDWIDSIADDLGIIATTKTILITKQGFNITELNSLTGKQICIPFGISLEQMIPATIKVERYDGRSDIHCLKMLNANRVDATIIAVAALPYYIKTLKMKPIAKNRIFELITEPIHLFISKKSKKRHLIPLIKEKFPHIKNQYNINKYYSADT